MIIGTQIAYIPNHAEGEISHPDVEFGFVTRHEEGSNIAICRYWRKGEPVETLVEHESVSQELIENELLRLGYR